MCRVQKNSSIEHCCEYRWEYDIIPEGLVEVCLAFYRDTSLGSLLDMAETVLSLVLNIISILLLFLTILTYALFPELRNLPGCNLMCLAVSTFISQVGRYSAVVVS
jgi:hypothetical protein